MFLPSPAFANSVFNPFGLYCDFPPLTMKTLGTVKLSIVVFFPLILTVPFDPIDKLLPSAAKTTFPLFLTVKFLPKTIFV